MGYTHYWEYDGDAETFAKTALDAKAIVAASPVPLAHGTDPKLGPEVSEGRIWLNGADDDDYETFGITAGHATTFDFCKTANKPYDIVVVAILIRFAQHGGTHVKVRSDGEWDSDWKAGRDLVAELFDDPPTACVFTER